MWGALIRDGYALEAYPVDDNVSCRRNTPAWRRAMNYEEYVGLYSEFAALALSFAANPARVTLAAVTADELNAMSPEIVVRRWPNVGALDESSVNALLLQPDSLQRDAEMQTQAASVRSSASFYRPQWQALTAKVNELCWCDYVHQSTALWTDGAVAGNRIIAEYHYDGNVASAFQDETDAQRMHPRCSVNGTVQWCSERGVNWHTPSSTMVDARAGVAPDQRRQSAQYADEFVPWPRAGLTPIGVCYNITKDPRISRLYGEKLMAMVQK